MSRTQYFRGKGTTTLLLANTPYQMIGVTDFVKSAIVQAGQGNTGVVTIRDELGNALVQLSAGRGATFKGDNMDNGTTAKFDASNLYAESTVAGDQVTLACTEGL